MVGVDTGVPHRQVPSRARASVRLAVVGAGRIGRRDCYVLSGTHGSLASRPMRLSTYAGAPSWHAPMQAASVDVQRGDPLARQLRHFAAVIRGTATPAVTPRDATESLRVTLAIAEAARTGNTVSCGAQVSDEAAALDSHRAGS